MAYLNLGLQWSKGWAEAEAKKPAMPQNSSRQGKLQEHRGSVCMGLKSDQKENGSVGG
jgi:hypothetical protein